MLDDAGAVVKTMPDSVFLAESVKEFFTPDIMVDTKELIFVVLLICK